MPPPVIESPVRFPWLVKNGALMVTGGDVATTKCGECCDDGGCGLLCELAGGAACVDDTNNEYFASFSGAATGVVSDCTRSHWDSWGAGADGSVVAQNFNLPSLCEIQAVSASNILHTSPGDPFCGCGCTGSDTFTTRIRSRAEYDLKDRIINHDPDDPNRRNDRFFSIPFGEVNETIPNSHDFSTALSYFEGVQREICGVCPSKEPAHWGVMGIRMIYQPETERMAGVIFVEPDALTDPRGHTDMTESAISANVSLAIRGVVAGVDMSVSGSFVGTYTSGSPHVVTVNAGFSISTDFRFVNVCCGSGGAAIRIPFTVGQPPPAQSALQDMRTSGIVL